MATARRRFGVLALLVLVVLAGCSGGGDGADASLDGQTRTAAFETQMAEATGTPMATGAPSDLDGGSADDQDVVVQERSRIKTGRATVEVGDFHSSRRNLTDAVERRGGFVSDTSEELHRFGNDTYTTGTIVLRVPKDNFSAMMQRVRQEGTVLESDEDSQDVTNQLVDIRARLQNLEAQRDRLRTLYDRANETSDILQIERRLTDVQTEIERLEARQQSLRQQVALSTIRVELREPRPEPETREFTHWYDTGVVAAFLESVNGVVVVARAAIVALAYALPYVLAFGVPFALVGAGVLWWRRQ